VNLETLSDPIWLSRTDPLADAAVQALFAEGGVPAVNRALALLSNEPPGDAWPKALREFVQAVPVPSTLDEVRLDRAQEAFMSFGVLGVAILACASLPETYCLPGTAKLLAMSGQLTEHVGRRLEMTGQMLFDVMTPRSLLPGGIAFKAVIRTRLMHAALRFMLLNELRVPQKDADQALRAGVAAWTAEFGQPVNQIELVYTLMTFSHVVLRSAVALGIRPQPEIFEDYIYAWNVVGRILGIDPALLPDSQAEAEQVFERIKAARARATPEATQLMVSLKAYWVSSWPLLMRPMAGPAMHAISARILSPETLQLLDFTAPESFLEHEAEALLVPASAGLRLAERVFETLPPAAHLAAAIMQHWANRRTAIPDGGLTDTHQHMLDAWLEPVPGGTTTA
jgi:hypothetical protein